MKRAEKWSQVSKKIKYNDKKSSTLARYSLNVLSFKTKFESKIEKKKTCSWNLNSRLMLGSIWKVILLTPFSFISMCSWMQKTDLNHSGSFCQFLFSYIFQPNFALIFQCYTWRKHNLLLWFQMKRKTFGQNNLLNFLSTL